MIILKRVDRTVIDEGENLYQICARNKGNLSGANLSGADLSGADLSGADLSGADLSSGANLSGADLSGAILRGAILRGADLIGTDLSSGANLSGADLSWADLSGADLSGADLSGAILRGANLSGANIEKAKLPHFQLPGGNLIGWKKVQRCVIELRIPAAAKRTATLISRKCRAEYVIDVFHHGGPERLVSDGMGIGRKTVYREGEIIRPDRYCDDIRIECSHGIHFFATREEAEEFQP